MLRLMGRPGSKTSYTSYLCNLCQASEPFGLSFLVCKVGLCNHPAPKAAVRIQQEDVCQCL